MTAVEAFPTRTGISPWDVVYFGWLAATLAVLIYAGSGIDRIVVAVGVGLVAAERPLTSRSSGGLMRGATVPVGLRIALLVFGVVLVAFGSPLVVLVLPIVVPRVFLAMSLGPAMVTAGVLFAASSLAVHFHGVEPRGWSTVPLAVGFVLCLMAGAWVSQVMALSESRAQAVLALQASQAELTRVSRQAGVSAERSRMAQEVHDGVTQRLTVTRMLLEAARLRHEAGASEEAQSRTAMAHDQVLCALAELRALLAETADTEAPSDGPTFAGSVESSVLAVAGGAGLESRTQVLVSDTDLRPEVRSVLLRVLREALSNVAAHAQARSVDVSVTRSGEWVVLSVSDDGIGVDGTAEGSALAGHGLGVKGMRARAETVGGRVSIDGGAGEGTVLTAWLPWGSTQFLASNAHAEESDMVSHHCGGPAVEATTLEGRQR